MTEKDLIIELLSKLEDTVGQHDKELVNWCIENVRISVLRERSVNAKYNIENPPNQVFDKIQDCLLATDRPVPISEKALKESDDFVASALYAAYSTQLEKNNTKLPQILAQVFKYFNPLFWLNEIQARKTLKRELEGRVNDQEKETF